MPSPITADKFGGIVSRHYIRCTADQAIVIGAQDKRVAMVDQELGNKTTAHTMDIIWIRGAPEYHQPFLDAYLQPAPGNHG